LENNIIFIHFSKYILQLYTALSKKSKEVFVENEFNFEIYGDFLNYIYQMMSNFNNEFSMRTFQE
jgi:hypothetical protein